MNLMLPSKSFKKVESVERADKIYFISITPKRNTIADIAIENLSNIKFYFLYFKNFLK